MYRRCVSVKEAHGDAIWAVTWGPGDDIVSGAVDGTCKRWAHEGDAGVGGGVGWTRPGTIPETCFVPVMRPAVEVFRKQMFVYGVGRPSPSVHAEHSG